MIGGLLLGVVAYQAMLPHLVSFTRITLPGSMTSLTSQGDFVILQTVRCRPVLTMLLYSAHCLVYSRNVLLRPYQRTVGRLFVNHIYVSTKRVLSQHKLRLETWYYLESGLFWLYTSFLATVLICPEASDHKIID